MVRTSSSQMTCTLMTARSLASFHPALTLGSWPPCFLLVSHSLLRPISASWFNLCSNVYLLNVACLTSRTHMCEDASENDSLHSPHMSASIDINNSGMSSGRKNNVHARRALNKAAERSTTYALSPQCCLYLATLFFSRGSTVSLTRPLALGICASAFLRSASSLALKATESASEPMLVGSLLCARRVQQ